MDERSTQVDLIFEYYLNRPQEEIKNNDAVQWAIGEYKQRTGKDFLDPNRAIC